MRKVMSAMISETTYEAIKYAIRKNEPSGKIRWSLNKPPSQRVADFPGIPHSQFFMSKTP
jgi:hypothetical protein